ncbi:MAG: hypothetical protein ACREF5_01150 [Candidatus Saccharimonadales bacterium]
MATSKDALNTKTPNSKYTNKKPILGSSLFTFVTAFMGVVIGVGASLAVVMPMVHSEFADQSRALSQKIVAMAPAADTLSCVQPSTTASTGQVLGASTIAATYTAPKNHPSASSTVFVSKLVSGVFANTTGTISNTGPNSKNVIATTNINKTTVTNDNNIVVSNSNHQSANSGNASVQNNTTAGAANSGNTSNDNDTSTTVDINN